MQCILCKTEGNQLSEDGRLIELFSCPNCKAHFSRHTEPANYDEYDKIYPGMKEYCQGLKDNPNYLSLVAGRGDPYEKVINWFSPKLKVLDVGCGWGYMVDTLRKLGYEAYGIDISQKAIDFARETFGHYFLKQDIKDHQEKHDIVLAVEVFEHVPNPREWMKRCLEIAPKVIITTPNIESYNTTWVSDNPPLHMACYTKESLEWLAKDLGVRVTIDSSGRNLFAIYES